MAFVHDVVFPSDLLQSFPNLVITNATGEKFQTNAALFAIFCPSFKSAVYTVSNFMDFDDATVILENLSVKEIQYLDYLLHDSATELENMEEEELTPNILFLRNDRWKNKNDKEDSPVDEDMEDTSIGSSTISGPLNLNDIPDIILKMYQVNCSQKDTIDCEANVNVKEDQNMNAIHPGGSEQSDTVPKNQRLKAKFDPCVNLPGSLKRKENTCENPIRKCRSSKPGCRIRRETESLTKFIKGMGEMPVETKKKGMYGLRASRKVRQAFGNEADHETIKKLECEVATESCDSDDEVQKEPSETDSDFEDPDEEILGWSQCQLNEKFVTHETHDRSIAKFELWNHNTNQPEEQTKIFLRSHVPTDVDGRFMCDDCPKRFYRKSYGYFITHVIRHIEGFPKLECNLCPQALFTEEAIYDHWEKQHFSEHKRIGNTFSCVHCGRTPYPNRFKPLAFLKHIKRHEPKKESVDRTMEESCIACGHDWRKNQIKHPLLGMEKRILKHKELMGPYHNDQCVYSTCTGVIFSTWDEHMEHVTRVHDGVFKHKCGFCEQLFDNEPILSLHRRKIHLKKTKIRTYNYTCHTCGKLYTNIDSLENHLLTLHSDHQMPLTHICEFCGKGFKTDILLTKHVERHKQARDLTKCNKCEKVFQGRKSMAASKLKRHHMTVHTPNNQKPFKCNKCGKRFIDSATFRNHLDIHENLRQHKCKYCGLGFNDPSNARAHQRKNCSERPM